MFPGTFFEELSCIVEGIALKQSLLVFATTFLVLIDATCFRNLAGEIGVEFQNRQVCSILQGVFSVKTQHGNLSFHRKARTFACPKQVCSFVE